MAKLHFRGELMRMLAFLVKNRCKMPKKRKDDKDILNCMQKTAEMQGVKVYKKAVVKTNVLDM